LFKIYYNDKVITGYSESDWNDMPRFGVQLVILFEPYPEAPYKGWTPWTNAPGDTQIHTGLDEYSIKGWEVKYGSWMDLDDYIKIWDTAIADNKS
jgi:hypothetical protein